METQRLRHSAIQARKKIGEMAQVQSKKCVASRGKILPGKSDGEAGDLKDFGLFTAGTVLSLS
jgi:hypothetical protein